MATLAEQLETLGLSDTEAKLYLAGLRTGPATVNDISLAADIKRTTAYTALDQLKDFGLARSYTEGRKTVFHVEHPEKLSGLLSAQRNELIRKETLVRDLIPELRSFVLEAGEKAHVELLVRPDKINELLFNKFSDSDRVFILGSDSLLGEYIEQLSFLEKFLVLRSQSSKETNILTDSVEPAFTYPSTLHIKQTKKKLSFASVLIFSNDSFLQIHVNSHMSGLHIENKDFMELLSFFFQFLWDAS